MSIDVEVAARFNDSEVTRGARRSRAEFDAMAASADQTADSVLNIIRQGAELEGKMTKSARKTQRSLARVESQLDDNARATNKLKRQVQVLDKALKQNVLSQARYNELLRKAKRQYDETAKGAGKYHKALSLLRTGFVKLGAATGGALAVGSIATGIVNAGNLEEQLERQLAITLKSQEAAVETVERIRDLSASTPLQVENLTTAWIALRTRGLEPTEKKLLEIGDLAAGNRKSLDQTVEALLDAQSLEFERLKEFGIRAKKEGDQVALTYAGVTKVIQGTADVLGNKVVDALLEISRANFAGSLESQAETLTGKWSTFSDLLGQLGGQIFRSGVGDALKGLVDLASDGIRVITDYGKSEEALTKFIEEQTEVFDGNAEAIRRRNEELKGLTPGGQATAEGKRLQELIAQQNQLEDAISFQRERLERARRNQEAVTGNLSHGGLTEVEIRSIEAGSKRVEEHERKLRELLKAREDSKYAIDNEREAMSFWLEVSAEVEGDFQKLTGVVLEGVGTFDDLASSVAGLSGQLSAIEFDPFTASAETGLSTLRRRLAELKKEATKAEREGDTSPELDRILRQIELLDERIKAVSKIQLWEDGAEAQIALLDRLFEALQNGASIQSVTVLRKELERLKALGLDIDSDGKAAMRVREVIREVEELDQAVRRLQKIKLFEEDTRAEIDLLMRVLERANSGASSRQISDLQKELETLQGLDIDLDDEGEQAERVRDLLQLLGQLKQRVDTIGQIRLFEESGREQIELLTRLFERAKEGAGAKELSLYRQELEALQGLELPLDDTSDQAEQVRLLVAEIRGLQEAVQKVEKIALFEADSQRELEVLQQLVEAKNLGATEQQIDLLERRLKKLQSLGIDINTSSEERAQVEAIEDRIQALRAELGSEETFRPLDDGFVDVISRFGDGLSNALHRAAEEGKLSFGNLFEFLLGQADNIAQQFERVAALRAAGGGTGGGGAAFGGGFDGIPSRAGELISDRIASSTGRFGPTQTGGNIAAAGKSITAVAGVLGAYYQLYTAVDGYVDKKKWERANQGSIRLKETIEGEVQGAIKTVGRDVFDLLSGLADSATEVLQDIVGQFGGTTSGLGLLDLELKVTDANQFSVLVNGFEREFGSASQEAFDFFITRALKSVDVEGVSSEIRQTLKNSRTEDLSTLEQELALAQQIAQLDFTDAQLSTEQFKTSLDELTDFAAERAFELSSFTRIGAASAREWVAFRATITGEQADPATLFAERSASFNRELARYRSEVEAQFQDYVDELLGLTSSIGAGMADSTEQLRQIRTGGGLFNQQGVGANNERPIDTATRITGGILDTAALTEAQAQELESRLAALRALLDGLPDPISPGEFRRGGGGRGRGRKERRENFQEELDRLRLDLNGASDVALTLRDWRLDLEREAEELRKAKVAEVLIDEWREIQETLRRGDLLENVRDRGRAIGATDLENSLHNLLQAHIAEREEAELLGVTREEMTEILRVQRGELEELVEQNRLARQEFADLAAGISEWDRQLRDSQAQFAEWRREEIALNEALGGSAEDLAAALGQLQDEQSAATDSLFGDLLSRIDAAGGEIPNFAENLITMEYALLRADLALAATTQGFEDFLAVQGTSLEQVLASINQAEQDALANLNGPSNAESVYRSRLEAQLRARQDEARDLASALESVQSALEQLRDDPTQTTTERFRELQSRYLEVLARAQTGDADAVREAARLAIELRDAGQTAFGGSRAAFRNLLADSRGDLEGLLDLQPSLEELGQTQIDLLAEINRNVGNWEPVVEVVLPIDPLVDAIDNLSIQVANPPLPVAVPVDPNSPPAPVDEPAEVPPPRPPPIPPQPPIPPPPVPPQSPPPPAPPPPPDSPPNVPVPRLTGGEDDLLQELRKLNANFERFERKVSTQDMAVIRGTRRG